MTDHLTSVRKYAAKADENHVAAIVKHLGIALRNRNSSLVACSDKAELDRVRESWCKRKLGLEDDSKIDAAIRQVCTTMHADHDKARVTFYYLLAAHFKKLDSLIKK